MKYRSKHYRSIWREKNSVYIVNQRKLPHSFEICKITNLNQMCNAIVSMKVRGAPLIGVSAAYGIALGIKKNTTIFELSKIVKKLNSTRPTAVNLKWATNVMLKKLKKVEVGKRKDASWQIADQLADNDVITNQKIGMNGLKVLKKIKKSKNVLNILTHCNAGWLATVDYGTALSPIFFAHQEKILLHVWVDETRPKNQGLLTAWELRNHKIDSTIICDNAGGHLMQNKLVDLVIVGADRISENGDVCNKIGTYLKALSAKQNNVPFFVAAPSSTIDFKIKNSAKEIKIEERNANELLYTNGIDPSGKFQTVMSGLKSSKIFNPAFDITPSNLVTGIITELGTFKPYQIKNLKNTVNNSAIY